MVEEHDCTTIITLEPCEVSSPSVHFRSTILEVTDRALSYGGRQMTFSFILNLLTIPQVSTLRNMLVNGNVYMQFYHNGEMRV